MLKLSWIGVGVAQAIEPKSTLQLKDREVSFLISFEDNSYIWSGYVFVVVVGSCGICIDACFHAQLSMITFNK